MRESAGYIRDWLEEGKLAYAYFNNTMGDAYNNQLVLTKYVRQASRSICRETVLQFSARVASSGTLYKTPAFYRTTQ